MRTFVLRSVVAVLAPPPTVGATVVSRTQVGGRACAKFKIFGTRENGSKVARFERSLCYLCWNPLSQSGSLIALPVEGSLSQTENDLDEPSIEIGASSVPAQLGTHYYHFQSEQAAHSLDTTLRALLYILGQHLDFGCLDGVSVSYDYIDTLKHFDTGFPASRPITPTNDVGLGVAIALFVLRDGVTKTHLVFSAQMLEPLSGNPENPAYSQAVYLVTHECAHIHDRAVLGAALPDHITSLSKANAQEQYYAMSNFKCWDEYVACRFSAPADPSRISWFEETFLSALDGVANRAAAHVARHRCQPNFSQLLNDVTSEYTGTCRYASYLIGHIMGLDGDMSRAPNAQEMLRAHWFSECFYKLAEALNVLWASYGRWTSLREFDAIGEIVRALVATSGVTTELAKDGKLMIRLSRAT